MIHPKRTRRAFFAAIVSVFALAGGAGQCSAGPTGHGGHMWNVIDPLAQPR